MKVELITNINVSVVKLIIYVLKSEHSIMRCGHCGGKLKLVKVLRNRKNINIYLVKGLLLKQMLFSNNLL